MVRWSKKKARSPARARRTAALHVARSSALARLVPLMYTILLVTVAMLSAGFHGKAPPSLTLYPALAFATVFVARLFAWWQRRGVLITEATAARHLKTTAVLAGCLAMALVTWATQLFPYGNAPDKAHVILFLGLSLLSSMFCLIHAWPAPVLIAGLGGLPFVVFLASHGEPALAEMAVDVVCVAAAALTIIWIQGKDFSRLVAARNEARRREQEQLRLLHMLADLPIAVITVDREFMQLTYANRAASGLVQQLFPHLSVHDRLVGVELATFGITVRQREVLLCRKADRPRQIRVQVGNELLEVRASDVYGKDERPVATMLTLAVVTEEVRSQQRILQLAHYDGLTGLLNRHALREKVQEAIATGCGVTVIILDLAGFKTVNDSLGQAAGDLLLIDVAERLRTGVRESTTHVGRLGADEFAVVLTHAQAASARDVSEQLLDTVCAPYALSGDLVVRISAAIGMARSPCHGADSETLLSRAGIALAAAKQAGPRAVREFTDAMLDAIRRRVALERRLRNALDAGEGIFVFFQPITDLATRRVVAQEALVRWHDPEDGWVSPGEFVPVAERSGLIDRLGEWVLRRACEQALRWPDEVRVCVNVSAAQLGKGTLVPRVLRTLQEVGLQAHRLELEVTETALLSGEESLGELADLRAAGLRVALDDFGTGFSSLAHLRSCTFDTIKIDGSFVRDAVNRPQCAAVVHAVAQLGQRLGVTTVAEGVETQEHLDLVVAEGCSEVQGYFFGRPAPGPDERAQVASLSRVDAQAAAVTPHPLSAPEAA